MGASSRKKSRGRGGKGTGKEAAAAAAAAAAVSQGVTTKLPASPEFSYAQAAAGVVEQELIPPADPGGDDGGDFKVPSGAYEEALDDVHTRFILNLPDEEFETADRIFFQLEQAYWFYDDILCDAGDDPDQPDMPKLPRFKNLRPFAKVMFGFSPLLEHMLPKFDGMYDEFRKYKHKISTYGTILLNQDCTRVLLCQAYFGNSWTFPAGKVNQHETGVEAGARETYEETGFDPNCLTGEAKRLKEEADEKGESLSWSSLRSEDALTYVEDGTKKRRTCYVCRGVPEEFPFAPVARKEVKDIQWYDIYDLPKKSYAVVPFIKQLRRWIRKNAKDSLAADGSRNKSRKKGGRDGSTKKGRSESRRANSRNGSRGKVREDDNLAMSGLASPGDDKRWTAEEMFEANEKLTGKKLDYDGNPHVFAEKGFDGVDPHAFRVVGGGFMNSGEGIQSLAPAPEKSRLQPLFREGDANEDVLTPFFSEEGATPWGEIVEEEAGVAVSSAATSSGGNNNKTKKSNKKKKSKAQDKDDTPVAGDSNDAGKNLLNMLHGKGGSTGNETKEEELVSTTAELDVFMTDREITSRSQADKLGTPSRSSSEMAEGGKPARSTSSEPKPEPQEDEHIIYMRQWAKDLPQAPPTEMFGDFTFDRDAIMRAMKASAK